MHQNQTLFTADKNNGFRFSVLPSYQNGTIEDIGALSLASHGYVDTKTGAVSNDLHTNYWTRTDANDRYYLKSNPSNYTTTGDVNTVKIEVEGYTDNAVNDLKAHVPYRTRDLVTDPWYYDCRFQNNAVKMKYIAIGDNPDFHQAANVGFVRDSITAEDNSIRYYIDTDKKTYNLNGQ